MQIFYSVPENFNKRVWNKFKKQFKNGTICNLFGVSLKYWIREKRDVIHWWIESQILAELSHVRSARSGAPLVMKFSYLCIQVVLVLRKSYIRSYVIPPLHVSWSGISYFKHPRVSAVNQLATLFFNDEIWMSTLTWITEKELELEIKNKGDEFRWKKNMKIL